MPRDLNRTIFTVLCIQYIEALCMDTAHLISSHLPSLFFGNSSRGQSCTFGRPSIMEIIQRPVLHVEVRVRSTGDGIIVRTDLVCHPVQPNTTDKGSSEDNQIRDDVTQWLTDNFVVLSLGQEIHSFGDAGYQMISGLLLF